MAHRRRPPTLAASLGGAIFVNSRFWFIALITAGAIGTAPFCRA